MAIVFWPFFIKTVMWLSCLDHFSSKPRRDYHVLTIFHQNSPLDLILFVGESSLLEAEYMESRTMSSRSVISLVFASIYCQHQRVSNDHFVSVLFFITWLWCTEVTEGNGLWQKRREVTIMLWQFSIKAVMRLSSLSLSLSLSLFPPPSIYV